MPCNFKRLSTLTSVLYTDYVADIYETITTTPRAELKMLAEELKMEVPEPVHTMWTDKETREDAVAKCKKRKEMETVICPPTRTGNIVSSFNKDAVAFNKRCSS